MMRLKELENIIYACDGYALNIEGNNRIVFIKDKCELIEQYKDKNVLQIAPYYTAENDDILFIKVK